MLIELSKFKMISLKFGSLSRTNRMMLGIVVLLIVDVIWVVSAEITKVSDIYKSFFLNLVHKWFLILDLITFDCFSDHVRIRM